MEGTGRTAPPALYQASVPVFRHYLGQVTAIVDRLDPGDLDHRIADAFPVGQQFSTAAGFALRIACPLAGRDIPGLPGSLGPRLAVARAVLGAMRPGDFDGAEAREITHQAGHAWLTHSAGDFLFRYGLPNFFFHLTMGYAALRQAGVRLGKADFDGQHVYPAPDTNETADI
jgi:hypothetical protein